MNPEFYERHAQGEVMPKISGDQLFCAGCVVMPQDGEVLSNAIATFVRDAHKTHNDLQEGEPSATLKLSAMLRDDGSLNVFGLRIVEAQPHQITDESHQMMLEAATGDPEAFARGQRRGEFK